MSTTRVLYIAGFGRSGSTLLDRLLGQVPGFRSCGELSYVWEMGLKENRLCGCGEPFRACPFWSEVGHRAFGGWDHIDLGPALALVRAVDRNRYIPLMLRTGIWRGYDARLRAYGEMLSAVAGSVREVSDADVIVDSTKFPSSAFVLRTRPDLDLRVVHLVRDSRGVAYSWSKRVTRPDVVGRTAYMRRYSAVRVGTRWVTRNLAVEALGRFGVPTLRIRYEDFVRSPREHLRAMIAFAGADADVPLGFLGEGSADLAPAHSVHGNPMRMEHGSVAIRLDEEWRNAAAPLARGIVTALTWPLLHRYGYAR